MPIISVAGHFIYQAITYIDLILTRYRKDLIHLHINILILFI